jgi:alcohol dehydrogenase (cytochrome c)
MKKPVLAALALLACHSEAPPPAPDTDWPYATGDFSGQRFSALAQITTENAGRLREVCRYTVGSPPSFQTNPLVIGGVMYLTASTTTIAVDARTCRQHWRGDRTPKGPQLWKTNRGAAVQGSTIVRGTDDGYIVAMALATGSTLWERKVANVTIGETFTMPPLAWDSLVFIGPAGSDNGVSGWIAAFQLRDGAERWRFRTVPDGVEGGAVWTPVTLDTATRTLYVAASNPSPAFAGGTDAVTNAVVAIDARTGLPRWIQQLAPGDSHDWDLTHAGPLYEVGGHQRIAAAGKDGVLWGLDRQTGNPVFSAEVATRKNVHAPVTRAGTYACPGVYGGVVYNGPAFSPRTGLLYVNSLDLCGTFTLAADPQSGEQGQSSLGGVFSADPTTWAGWLSAVDGATGAIRWRRKFSLAMLAAVTVTAGDVLFTGELTGDFHAIDARSGRTLYTHNLGLPIGGGVVTFAVGGTQYVAVSAGAVSSSFPVAYRAPASVTVFTVR